MTSCAMPTEEPNRPGGKDSLVQEPDNCALAMLCDKGVIMLELFVRLAVIGVVVAFSTVANAGCACQCVDGQIQPACTNTFDIPPICSLRTCPFDLTPRKPPLGGASACKQEQECDIYGHCEWKQVCK
jgi:hypothetical protein